MDDLISRQAAISHLKKRLIETAINNTGLTATCDAVFADIADNRIETWITELPSAQPERKTTEWISVKDRLPEKDKVVIALIIGSDFIIQKEGETLADAIARAQKHKRVTPVFLDEDGWNGLDGFPEIIAPSYWMPLPEPPKEGPHDLPDQDRDETAEP